MARKAMVIKENRRLEKANRYKAYRDELRRKAKDISLSFEERDEAQLKLQKLPRNSSFSRHRNRCQITGRSRGYYRKFQMSRLSLREYANRGLLPGVTKASW